MNKRRNFSAKFKTQVVLEALKEQQTLSELAQKHGLHLNQISKWKQEFLASAETVFEKGKAKKKDGGRQKAQKAQYGKAVQVTENQSQYGILRSPRRKQVQ